MKRLTLFLFCFLSVISSMAQEVDEPVYRLGVLGVRDTTTKTFNGLSVSIAVTPSTRKIINGGLVGGLVATGAEKVNGFAVGFLYTYIDTVNGLTISPSFAFVDYTKGVQIALLQNSIKSQGLSIVVAGGAEDAEGVYIGAIGIGSGYLKGISIGPINGARVELKGAQIGAYNYTKSLKGIQIGAFNQATSAKGVQIGLINYIKDNPKWLRILPIINMRW